ncbi:MAG: hypothetical protein K2Y23_06350 [Cyanobacteria bacterium]|nr:hypothetical protein [Cyanobacteriota bacterium]
MHVRALADTGALLAYLDGTDSWHQACREAIIEGLMRNYRDRPMDFADASLVHLAQRESLSTVFTIDHDDFETYRAGGRKRLRILPSRGLRRS